VPEFIGQQAPVQTSDEYTDALTIGPAAAQRLNYSNLGVNAAFVQFWKFANTARNNYTLEALERYIPPQTSGAVAVGVAGARFRSYMPGLPALITAELVFETDPMIDSPAPSAVAISDSGNTTEPVTVNVASLTPAVTPVYVADPGPGVSSVDLYTVPAGVLTTFTLVSYQLLWDPTGGLGDRAVLYDIVDPNGGGPGVPERFVWAQSGNVVYTDGSPQFSWLETDVGSMGNFLRTITAPGDITDDPFDFGGGGVDFEQAAAPFGDAQWPEGWTLRLTVPHMAATDELSAIRLLVSEITV
jgi:hypothetical protein